MRMSEETLTTEAASPKQKLPESLIRRADAERLQPTQQPALAQHLAGRC